MNTKENNIKMKSNVLNKLSNKQIIQLKGAFELFDADKDGKISVKDLLTFTESMGLQYTEKDIKDHLEDIRPTYDTLSFYRLFGDLLDSEIDQSKLIECFKLFDSNNTGKISKANFIAILGEKLNYSEIENLICDCTDKDADIDYLKLCTKIKHGEVLSGTDLE